MDETDVKMLQLAIKQAEIAAALGEVPVGAVICRGDEVVAEAHNRRETGKNALYHAEIIAIDDACKKLGGWRLHQCDIYVTLEPCPMCAGAIINARFRRVVFGARDPKAGCLGSLCDFSKIAFNHQPEIVSGLLEDECASLLTSFFKNLRNNNQKEP